MNTLEAIYTRRSTRKFTKESVPKELQEELIKAAMFAPSAYNQQPWQFIIIDDKELLKQIPSFHPHAAMCKEAPLAILVCGDLRLEISKSFWIQDCCAAVENLLLAAHEKGLGAVWTGVHPREEREAAFRQMCKLPKEVIPLSFVVIGYPAEKVPTPPQRFKKERIHHNGW